MLKGGEREGGREGKGRRRRGEGKEERRKKRRSLGTRVLV